ncbi:MAG: hypothetical protein HONBIEJF_03049 [Fimbriimonadaceae bacterium]|nr:hypothetical protein [Fimbriimonadaceae bacterium]
MQDWFLDAKLGIFIHWGIYAVDGTTESWAFFNGDVDYDTYMNQRHGFTAAKYDPESWANLFRRAGARYAVLTTKHHDGIALWDTQANDLSVVKQTPAGRDLIAPYAESIRNAGLKLGFYFSHLDWSHPDYASIASDDPNASRFAHCMPPSDLAKWERFLAFHRAQLHELCTQFGDVDLLWFDGDWERDAQTWRMKELRNQLEEWQPNAVLNSRLVGYGDYATPEQGLPINPPDGPWEFCMTINDNWGWRPSDTNYKSGRMLLRLFAETIGLGGNLLLDITPMADGVIPEIQIGLLERLGAWIHRNAAAIYGTRRGIPHGHFHGPTTLSKDGRTLFLFCLDGIREQTCVRGLRTEVNRASLVSTGQEVHTYRNGGAGWSEVPGVLWIDVPVEGQDPDITVIRLDLAEPIDLYEGAGRT